jgi:1-acyl-sn-glycerol-3-phosphate acyltransferase
MASSFLYPIKTISRWYSLLFPWVASGVDLFVSDLHINGLENIPGDGPVMLIANHQNAMLDPLICCRVFPRQLHWLTRSDVFKNKKVASFLHQIHMLPIYREKDNVSDQMQRNEEVFKVCRERLSNGAVIAMFPEGSHRGKKQLLTPLKKGFARLAFSSIQNDERLTSLKIVPMGLDYSHFLNYQPRLVLTIGKPISLSDFWPTYLEDENKAINQLVRAAHESLSEVMIDIRDDEHYQMLIDLEPLFWNDTTSSVQYGFQQYKQWTEEWLTYNEEERGLFVRYHHLLSNARISANEVERAFSYGWRQRIGFWLECIPGIMGAALFYPMYAFAEWFIRKNIKDELFFNSIRLAIFTFLMPVYLLFLGAFTKLILPLLGPFDFLLGLLFIVSIGLFAISWNKKRSIWKDAQVGKKFANQHPAQWEEIKKVRNQIKKNG